MLVPKALTKTCGMPRHTVVHKKLDIVTQLLRHLQFRPSTFCLYNGYKNVYAARKTVACQSGYHVSSSSSVGPLSSNLLPSIFNSASAFERIHVHFFITSALLKQTECLFTPKRKDCRKNTVSWQISNIRNFHTSVFRKDIPEYLYGNVSEVSSAENDLLDEELEDDVHNDLEDDIVDFLTSRLISYEETDTSFVIHCPTCSTKECDSRVQGIFVDKNSGYFVCPWCSQDGTWEKLMLLLNAHEDYLTKDQLSAYLATTLPISEVGELALQESPLQRVSKSTLEKFGARLTSDEARIVVPITTVHGEVVGFESISLLHQIPQIVRRYVVGEVHAFGLASSSRKQQKVIVVPTCCDVLALAEHNFPAVSLPSANAEALQDYLLNCGKNEVMLWFRGEAPPRPFTMSLIQAGVTCFVVQSEDSDCPVHRKSLVEIKDSLKNAVSVVSETITTFHQLKDKIYHRLIHKEETCGVKWKRFTELNELLLGHRLGEMTVLTGPTGSGKTTFMAEYSLDLCSQGVNTLWGSFEVSIVRLCEVMLQQFSGAPLPQDSTSFNTLASEFSTLPLHFLTYHGQQSATSVLKAMTEAVKVWGIKHVIIDNLQFMLGTNEHAAVDRWWEQDKAVTAFRRFATFHNCHVTLIVHPKKVPDGQPLSIGSVFGGAKVTQEADNVLILQVKDGLTINQSRKILQVVKNRYGGQLGVLPLKFHKESLTFSSCFRQKNKDKMHTKVDAQNNMTASSLRKLSVKGFQEFEN